MPDTDLQPTDTAPPPAPPISADKSKSMDDMAGVNYDAITKADTDLLKKKIGTEAAMADAEQHRDSQYRTRMDRMIAAEGATMDDIKPWNAEKELAEHKTGLWDQFGSPGFIVSMIASAFTAQPMNSALTSGAAAMNAINQGDMEGYNKAFDAYKENTTLTLKRLELEKQQFEQIDKLRSSDMTAWRDQAAALLARFNDQRGLILLQNGMDDQVIDIKDKLAKSAELLSNAHNNIQNNDIRTKLFQALNGDNKDPKKMAQAVQDAERMMTQPRSAEDEVVNEVISQPGFRDLPSEEQTKKITDAVAAVSAARYPNRTAGGGGNAQNREVVQRIAVWDKENPDASEPEREAAHDRIMTGVKAANAAPVTGNKKLDVESHIGQYDDALKIIDGIEGTLNKYAGAAGAAGRVTRLGERVGNLLGSNQTDRTQMMRDIEQLQLMGPRLLLDQKTGRPLSTEAGHIADIIAGLKIGDTTANTLRSMREIKDRLTVIRDRNKANLGGASPVAEPVKTDDSSGSWDDFPAVH